MGAEIADLHVDKMNSCIQKFLAGGAEKEPLLQQRRGQGGIQQSAPETNSFYPHDVSQKMHPKAISHERGCVWEQKLLTVMWIK